MRELYPPAVVRAVAQIPGASYSFLAQLCAPEGAEVRWRLGQALTELPEPVAAPVAERLCSLNNLRFFQGVAELAALHALLAARWTLAPRPVGGLPVMVPPGLGPERGMRVLALGFVQGRRPALDDRTRRRLLEALDRVRSRRRFAVFLRAWLPPGFEPEPVRRAVELWLRQVEAGEWSGRHAAYDDEGVALEFSVVDERVRPGESPVASLAGPFVAASHVTHLGGALVRALAETDLGHGTLPVLAFCVSDVPWGISPGYVRELFYGRARWIRKALGAETSWEVSFRPDQELAVFKDPALRRLVGVALLERNIRDPLRFTGQSWWNPFAVATLPAGVSPTSVLAPVRWEEGAAVLRWHERIPDAFHLGGAAPARPEDR